MVPELAEVVTARSMPDRLPLYDPQPHPALGLAAQVHFDFHGLCADSNITVRLTGLV